MSPQFRLEVERVSNARGQRSPDRSPVVASNCVNLISQVRQILKAALPPVAKARMKIIKGHNGLAFSVRKLMRHAPSSCIHDGVDPVEPVLLRGHAISAA